MCFVYLIKIFLNYILIIIGLLFVNYGIVDNCFCDIECNDCYKMGKGKDDSIWVNGILFWNLV